MTAPGPEPKKRAAFPSPTTVHGRITAVGAVVLLVSVLLALWPQTVGTRDCGNAFSAREDPVSDMSDALRSSALLPPEATESCDEVRSDAQETAVTVAGLGVLLLFAGWVVSARKPE